MGHYHCEVIMPPYPETEWKERVDAIMAPFSEHDDDSEHPLWDWYVIGGRWNGEKVLRAQDEDKVE
ncbi:MAG: hypothetical protein OXG15_02485, partial [Gammaproteobacteria bacterium]|nr:hypothetical protein [Gammaproteobacteria bacterium]